MAPLFPDVGRLDNRRNAAQPADRGCEKAAVKQMRVQDVYVMPADETRQTQTLRDIAKSAKGNWKNFDIGRQVLRQAFGDNRCACQVGPETIPVETSQESEYVLLRASAGCHIGKVQN